MQVLDEHQNYYQAVGNPDTIMSVNVHNFLVSTIVIKSTNYAFVSSNENIPPHHCVIKKFIVNLTIA